MPSARVKGVKFIVNWFSLDSNTKSVNNFRIRLKTLDGRERGGGRSEARKCGRNYFSFGVFRRELCKSWLKNGVRRALNTSWCIIYRCTRCSPRADFRLVHYQFLTISFNRQILCNFHRLRKSKKIVINLHTVNGLAMFVSELSPENLTVLKEIKRGLYRHIGALAPCIRAFQFT